MSFVRHSTRANNLVELALTDCDRHREVVIWEMT